MDQTVTKPIITLKCTSTPPLPTEADPRIVIIRSLLPSSPAHLHSIYDAPTGNTHKMCYMGQILHGLGHKVITRSGPCRSPVDAGIFQPPFTQYCRGRLVQTDLCTRIMNLRPSLNSEQRIIELLPNYTFNFID